MRLIQFLTQRGLRIGLERNGDKVLDLGEHGIQETSLRALLEGGPERLEEVKRLTAQISGVNLLDKKDLKIVAPISDPSKLLCVGMNYRDHCEEQNAPIPKEPVFFSKCVNAITGPTSDIQLPEVSKEVDWEVELAFVIAKTGKNVPLDSAMDYVAGYVVANDVSARDWQFKPESLGQWLLGKSMDGFCPLGPALVTKDEIQDPHNLGLRLRINGVTKQSSNTNQLVFDIPAIISYVSRLMTLSPGDVILTGTPPGVGCFRSPKEFIKSGDVMETEIDGIGTIVNRFV